MPPVLYRQAETGRYGGSRRTVPAQVWQAATAGKAGQIRGFRMFRFFKHFVFNSVTWALHTSNDDILVGGQAVIEGVMMRSPQGYSVAVRRQDGSIRTIKDSLKTAGDKWKAFKLPVLRGMGVLGQALVLG